MPPKVPWQEAEAWLTTLGLQPMTGVGQVGKGTFGTVYTATAKSGLVVAIKFSRSFDPQAAKRESDILVLLRQNPHPNVLQVFAHRLCGRPSLQTVQVFEYAMADLCSWLQRGSVCSSIAGRLALHLAGGLAHIHSLKIMHRDLKPSNMVLFANPHLVLKLADFGSAAAVDDGLVSLTPDVATSSYRAPEMWKQSSQGGRVYDQNSDMWAAGCLFFELTWNRTPCFSPHPKNPGHIPAVVAAAIGPPPAGFFSKSFFPLGAVHHTPETDALQNMILPEARSNLLELHSLASECLQWVPTLRPSASACHTRLECSPWLLSHPPLHPDFSQPSAERLRPKKNRPSQPDAFSTQLASSGQRASSFTPGPAGTAEPAKELVCSPEAAVSSGPRRRWSSQSLLKASLLPMYDSDSQNSEKSLPDSQAPYPREGYGFQGFLAAEEAKVAEAIGIQDEQPLEICKCLGKNHCNHGRRKCTRPAEGSHGYCISCVCREPGCQHQQLRNLGYCFQHCHKKSAPEMQMVKALGDAGLLPQLTPFDVEVFIDACCSYYSKHGNELDPVFEVIAAWLKSPFWVDAWRDLAPGPDSSAEEILSALHQVIRAMSGKSDPETSFNLRSGRGIGFSACCRFLGVARSIKPNELVEGEVVPKIGSRGKEWVLLQDHSRIESLRSRLRPARFGGRARDLPKNPVQHAQAWHTALKLASQDTPMGLYESTYARPHIVRKHLLVAQRFGFIQSGDQLGMKQLQEMQMPDQHDFLSTVPSYLHKVRVLGSRFSCHPLLLTCFACLAHAPMKFFPRALEVALHDPDRLAAALQEYRDKFKYAPSLERLFQLVFDEEGPPRDSSSSSVEVEAKLQQPRRKHKRKLVPVK